MKKLLAILMCFTLCFISIPTHALGGETRTITVANSEFGEIFIDGMNENGRIVTVPVGHIAEIGATSAHGYEIGSVTKKMYIYNDGASGWANIADYLIYEGPNAASAPIEISVVVLKNAPAAGNTFGGINYGSGTGVKWTKP